MNRGALLFSLLVLVLLFAMFRALSVKQALADPSDVGPAYVGLAKYYDNRKSVVTSTHDDLAYNTSVWQSCLSMLSAKRIYHTVSVITNASQGNDWGFVLGALWGFLSTLVFVTVGFFGAYDHPYHWLFLAFQSSANTVWFRAILLPFMLSLGSGYFFAFFGSTPVGAMIGVVIGAVASILRFIVRKKRLS